MKINFTLPFQHWPLKLLALAIGFILWYGITTEDQVDMILAAQIELRNLPANMIIANQYQQELEVAARGPGRLLAEIQQRRISRPVDLSDASIGVIPVLNTPESIDLPRGITVQHVQPAHVKLVVDKLIEREIPLHAITSGKPMRGFSVKEVRLTPSAIHVSGPLSQIGKVQAIDTLPIDVTGHSQSTVVQTGLLLNDALRRLLGETSVEAEILLAEPMVKRTIRHIPISIVGAGADDVFPQLGTVSVEAELPVSLTRDNAELKDLFLATVNARQAEDNGKAPILVKVYPQGTPYQASITIISQWPREIMLPAKSSPRKNKGARLQKNKAGLQ